MQIPIRYLCSIKTKPCRPFSGKQMVSSESPYTEPIKQYINASLKQIGFQDSFIKKIEMARFDKLVSCTYPYATKKNYHIPTTLILCMYFYDKLIDKSSSCNIDSFRHLHDNLLAALENKPIPNHQSNHLFKPVELMYAHLGRQLADFTNVHDFINAFHKGFQSKEYEVLNRSNTTSHHLPLYNEIRYFGSGCEVVFELGYLLKNININSIDRNNINFIMSTRLATQAIYLSNDIKGLEMEKKEKNNENIIMVLNQYPMFKGSKLEENPIIMFDETIKSFNQIGRHINKYSDLNKIRTVQKEWIDGNEEWMRHSIRFTKPGQYNVI